MSDAAPVSLTLGQVVDLISRAKAGRANPIVIGMQIFNALGDDVTVAGSTLALALTTSGIKVDPLFMPLVNAIQTVSKTGDHVSVSLDQPIEVQKKIKVDFAQEMSFDVRRNTKLLDAQRIWEKEDSALSCTSAPKLFSTWIFGHSTA